MLGERKRKSFNGHVSGSTKRVRADQEENSASSTYERLQGARFPPEVEALGHVLDHIDILLMTREEAVVEAARSGQVAWLRQLIHGDGECTEATRDLVIAAANGNVECVETLLPHLFNGDREESMWYHWKQNSLQEAVAAAATNGLLDTVKLLLQKEGYSCQIGVAASALEALDQAVANGHLGIVKFVMQYIEQHDHRTHCDYLQHYKASRRSLACAILAGHWSVVEFVLGLGAPWMDLVAAFRAAVDVDQPALADRIHDIFPRTVNDRPLMVQLGRDKGSVNAVKYLFNHGHNQPGLVSQAFETAASYGHADTVEFLFGTGLVSSDAFDRALVMATRMGMYGAAVLVFLCSKKCAPSQSIKPKI